MHALNLIQPVQLSFTLPTLTTTASAITSLFHATIATASSYSSTILAGAAANIVPVTAALVGVTLGLVFLWKKVYGQNETAEEPKRAATPEPKEPATPAPVDQPPPALLERKPSKRDTIREHIEKLGIIEMKNASSHHHYKTRARAEKIVVEDGVHYRVFPEDHDGYEKGRLYLILGWTKGKHQNDYLVLEKLPTTQHPQTPREGTEELASCESDSK